ncbi:hypothetical protein H5410_039620 [Solanum commersonii]|uniref:Uncharacterized protein n=1 Tax=Solanum commersonii TaxID=4109 RepID=A0A9J5XMS4_SOLCO|nr:hypothetical protein H5410_039620 [Solanum commersonii]
MTVGRKEYLSKGVKEASKKVSSGGERNHLVCRETVTAPKNWDGLGVKDLKVFNKALLGKWLWGFRVEVQSLWRGVIVDKHGEMEEGWRTTDIMLPFGCGVEEYHEGLGGSPANKGDTREELFWDLRFRRNFQDWEFFYEKLLVRAGGSLSCKVYLDSQGAKESVLFHLEVGEDVEHLLLYCTLTRRQW